MAIKEPDKLIEAARADKRKEFYRLCDEAIDKANELLKGSKDKDYNRGGVEITDYSDCIGDPIKAAFCPCWRKALREKSLMASGNTPENESLLDTIVDHLNYLRMLYSTVKLNS